MIFKAVQDGRPYPDHGLHAQAVGGDPAAAGAAGPARSPPSASWRSTGCWPRTRRSTATCSRTWCSGRASSTSRTALHRALRAALQQRTRSTPGSWCSTDATAYQSRRLWHLRPRPLDLLDLDALLTRGGARHPRPWCAGSSTSRCARTSAELVRGGSAPGPRAGREFGAARPARHAPDRLRLRRRLRRRLRAGLPGAGGRRLRACARLVSVQGSLAMYAIWRYGSEEQKQQWLPRDGGRRGDRLLRPDRARPRLRPGVDGDPGPARRRRLGARRHQDVDHQRAGGRRRRGLGPHRRGHPRLRRADGHARA